MPSLQSGVNYGIRLFAFNQKGNSNETRVSISTLKNPEKQTDYMPLAPTMEDLKPFLPVIMGAVGGLLLIALLIIAVVRSRGGGREDGNNMHAVSSSRTANSQLTMDSIDESIEKNPDIIPHGEYLVRD